MDRATRWIGSLVIALMMIGVPVLTVVSFTCEWPVVIRWIGITMTVFETIILWDVIAESCEL